MTATPPSIGTPGNISVVIPTHDRAVLVVRAIESALAQTAPAAEVIVVDDGSSDDTAERVTAFGGRVRYLHQPNGGASVARNSGVEAAAGPWIAFLDSDDRWAPTHLANMGAAIEATAGRAVLYFADAVPAGPGGHQGIWRRTGFDTAGPWQLAEPGDDWIMLPTQPMTMSASVVAKAAWLAAGGQRPALRSREDTHLFFRVGLGAPICAVAGGGSCTNPDESMPRLTVSVGSGTTAFWQSTVYLYRDVLEHAPDLDRERRRVLRARLAAGHLRLARIQLGLGRPLAATANAARGLHAHPPTVGKRVVRLCGLG